jgi:hypothetical protein
LLAARKSGLVHQAENFETFAARKLAVIEHLQQIHQAETVLRGVIPKMLVASAPEVPCIALPMISSGERLTPPSIGLKTSAVIWGKSAVLFSCRFSFVDRLVFCSRQTQVRRTYRRRVRFD